MEGLRHRGESKRPTTQAFTNGDKEEEEKLIGGPSPASSSLAERLQNWILQIFGKVCDALHITSGPELSPAELRQLSPFEEYAAVPFSHQIPEHQQALRDLWALFSKGLDPPDASMVFSQWKDYGFQQSDPGSDFRAVGVFGIHNLLFFADNHPAEFARMAPEVEDGYPFAISGLNITMMLLAMLDISGHKTCFTTTHVVNKRARKSLAALILQTQGGAEPDVRSMERNFGHVYCTAFLVLDKAWQQLPSPSMLVFNEVLVKVKKRMDELLIASKTIDELQRQAGI